MGLKGNREMADLPHGEKYALLGRILAGYGKLAVAFSGGVDSVFLLKAAADALGAENVLALTVRAVNFPASEFRDAEDFAKQLGVRHHIVDIDVLGIPGFVENSPERCYFCKKALFGEAAALARDKGFPILADGANLDDLGDYRPGTKAAKELGVVSPLREAELRKAEIRDLLKYFAIPLYSKPAYACLASRIPYGTRIEREALVLIEQAEEYFHENGFEQVRVRVHGNLARIELEPEERDRFARDGMWDRTAEAMKRIGFAHAALDLSGYKKGSMNEAAGIAIQSE